MKNTEPPPPESFGFSILPKKTAKERLCDAREFLRIGKQEIEKGRGIAEKTMIREGCEKVFHALVEASAARIQKLGIGVPENHEEIRQGLYLAGPPELLKMWDDAFLNLHVLSYYRGWLDFDRIEKSVKEVKAFTQDEIAKALGFVRGQNFLSDLASTFSLNTLLENLVREGRIVKRLVNTA